MRAYITVYLSGVLSLGFAVLPISAIMWPFGKRVEPTHIEKLVRLVKANPRTAIAVTAVPLTTISFLYRKPIVNTARRTIRWSKQNPHKSIPGAVLALACLDTAYKNGYFNQKFLVDLAVKGERWVLKNKESFIGISLFLALGALGNLLSWGFNPNAERPLLDESTRNELITILSAPLGDNIDEDALNSFMKPYINDPALQLIVNNFIKKRAEFIKDAATAPANMAALVEATKKHLSAIVVSMG